MTFNLFAEIDRATAAYKAMNEPAQGSAEGAQTANDTDRDAEAVSSSAIQDPAAATWHVDGPLPPSGQTWHARLIELRRNAPEDEPDYRKKWWQL